LEEVDWRKLKPSIVNNHGGTDADVKARIGKARVASLQLKNIWSARTIATQTKIRIFNSDVKSVLLYGSETWRLGATAKIAIFCIFNTKTSKYQII